MSGAVTQDGKRREGGRTPDGDRQWRVLFIGDHGKVIAFKRIKTLLGLAVGVAATALTAIVVLAVVNARLHGRVHEVQERLSAAQLQIQALHRERDLLTAHVVLAETKAREALAGVSRPAPVQKPDPAVVPGKAAEAPALHPADAATESQPAAAGPPGGGQFPAGMEETVVVENFYVGLDAARRTLHLRYKLVAARSARKPLAGHVIAVLKGDDIAPERWMAMPSVDLPKGRPSGRQKGFTFSISHSKAFSHSLPAPAGAPAYTQAVVYVFTPEGHLMTARDYSIDIKSAGE